MMASVSRAKELGATVGAVGTQLSVGTESSRAARARAETGGPPHTLDVPSPVVRVQSA